jgi:hypothetical protein
VRAADTSSEGAEFVAVTVLFRPPLDLGLELYAGRRQPDAFSRALERVREEPEDVRLNVESFDSMFVVRGDEVERVRLLLANVELRDALHAARFDGIPFRFDDQGCRIAGGTTTADDAWVEAVGVGTRIVKLADAARASVPCASSLRTLRAHWLEYADSAGMTVGDLPLSMHGSIGCGTMSLLATRTRKLTHGLGIRIAFDRPLGLGLFVRPTDSPFEAMLLVFVGQDHKLGDREFDAKFVVRAPSADGLHVVLDQETRQRLVELGSVCVRDDGMEKDVPRMSRDPAEIMALVTKVRQTAARIVENTARLRATHEGVYR